MPNLEAFRGYVYNKDKVGSLDNVVTPPYDVIDDTERAILRERHPNNMVHVLLPEAKPGQTAHEAAAEALNSWLADSVFVQDNEPHYYLLRQTFTGPDGRAHVRKGFFAALKLPEPDEDFVLGHERTFEYKVNDRIGLTIATQTNLGAVFLLYADPDGDLNAFLGQMDAGTPDLVANTIDGVKQEVWCVPANETVRAFFKDKTLYVADGHHRFKTACAYRDRKRAEEHPDGLKAYDYALTGLIAFDDPGLMIYPPHRVIDAPAHFDADAFLDALREWFAVETTDNLAEAVEHASGCAMGLAMNNGGRYLLTLKDIDRSDMLGDDHGPAWRDLDVAILHRGIIERILGLPEGAEFVYERDAAKAIAMVTSGDKGLAFILNATRPEQVSACADAHEFMPQKSTYFFPKLPSGMVINRLR